MMPPISIIADGHHLHPASLRVALAAKKPGKAMLVTDAMPSVGSTLTEFRLGGERVELKDGVLRNERGSLAGSHLNMLEAVRNMIALTGIHWTEAVRMASTYPARAAGVADRRGYICPGYHARPARTQSGHDAVSGLARGECQLNPLHESCWERIRESRRRRCPAHEPVVAVGEQSSGGN